MNNQLFIEEQNNTDRLTLSGRIDDQEFGVRGFCYSYTHNSVLKKTLQEGFHVEYIKESPAHQQGEATFCLVTNALRIIPGLGVIIPDWNSNADCGLKWDFLLDWEEKEIFFPIQVKSSKNGTVQAILKEMELEHKTYKTFLDRILKPIQDEIGAASFIRSRARRAHRLHNEHCEYQDEMKSENGLKLSRITPIPEEADEENSITMRETDAIKELKEIKLEYRTSNPLYLWADTSVPKTAIKQIITSFSYAFGVECDIETLTTAALENFQKDYKDDAYKSQRRKPGSYGRTSFSPGTIDIPKNSNENKSVNTSGAAEEIHLEDWDKLLGI
jgi:hypothetical protein